MLGLGLPHRLDEGPEHRGFGLVGVLVQEGDQLARVDDAVDQRPRSAKRSGRNLRHHLRLERCRIAPIKSAVNGQLSRGSTQAPAATLSIRSTSQGREHVAVADWQGGQCGHRRAAVHAPSPGAHAPLLTRPGVLPGIHRASGGAGYGPAVICRAGVRGISQVWPPRARLPAGAL
jgi:hypothetical protein